MLLTFAQIAIKDKIVYGLSILKSNKLLNNCLIRRITYSLYCVFCCLLSIEYGRGATTDIMLTLVWKTGILNDDVLCIKLLLKNTPICFIVRISSCYFTFWKCMVLLMWMEEKLVKGMLRLICTFSYWDKSKLNGATTIILENIFQHMIFAF